MQGAKTVTQAVSRKQPAPVDTLITGATIVTMNEDRHVIKDGAIAISGDKIAAVGKRSELESLFVAKTNIDGRSFVITPGLIDAHIHITGDPLTRGIRRGPPGMGFNDVLSKFVIPLFKSHTPYDEQISAQFAALRMLHSGVTCFIEAGTTQHLDEVVEGLNETGIRGRVGAWVEGRAFETSQDGAKEIDKAIATLETQARKYPQTTGARIAAWPILIGHTVNPDEVWQAAKRLADENDVCLSAHMSPYSTDTEWFLQNTGKTPIEHLADVDVLGENVLLTHVSHISDREFDILCDTGTNVIFCPHAAANGAFGVTSGGRYPEMANAGVNLMLGTDGVPTDILSSAMLMSGLFKDARKNDAVFPPSEVFEMITVNGAKGFRPADQIGVLAQGRKADLACHDVNQPHWFPELDIVDQLIHSSSGSSVHSVWVDGERVIENYRSTKVDEDALLLAARRCSADIVKRSGVTIYNPWPVIE